jgi:hypothetical protein
MDLPPNPNPLNGLFIGSQFAHFTTALWEG